MLILNKHILDAYSVLDTDDLTIETVSKDELKSIIASGVKIFGVTDFSLEYDVDVFVILRLYSKDSVKDFDGLILRDMSNDYNECLVQIIDYNDIANDLITDDRFNAVVSSIRNINKFDDSILKDAKTYPVGYTVTEFDESNIYLMDNSGEEFACDFYTCLSIYVDEHLSIKDIDMHLDYMLYNTEVFSADTILKKYRDDFSKSITSRKRIDRSSNTIYDSLDACWADLGECFGTIDCIRATEMGFPLYNIRRYIYKYGRSMEFNFGIFSSKAIDYKKEVLYFDNGGKISDFNTITMVENLLNMSDEVKHLLEIRKTKEAIVRGDGRVKELEALRKVGVVCQQDERYDCSYRCNTLRSLLGGFKTSKGVVAMVNNTLYMQAKYSYDALWLVRYTHIGSVAYYTTKNRLLLDTSTNINRVSPMTDVVLDACTRYKEDGYTYCKNLIVPLGLSSLNDSGDFIDLNVACLIMPDSKYEGTTCFNVVEVPLLFIGQKFDEFTDCFRLRCLFMDIYMSKHVVYSLNANFSESNIEDLWGSQRTNKKQIRVYNALYKSDKQLFSSIFDK